MPCSTFHLSCSLFCFPFPFFFYFVFLFFIFNCNCNEQVLVTQCVINLGLFSSFLNFQNIYTETLVPRKYLLDILLTSSP